MSNINKQSLTNGNGISPKHFIYLDRSRLFSYTAQFSDGLPQLRHLLDSVNEGNIDTGVEWQKEEVKEYSNEVEGSVGSKSVVGSVAGKKENKKIQKRSLKESDPTRKYEALQTLSQVKVEHDNLYLLLEQDLINAGLLTELNDNSFVSNQPRLIKAKGVTRFFDWGMLADIYSNADDIVNIMPEQAFENNEDAKEEIQSKIKSLSNLMKILSIGNITVHIQRENSTIAASLNTEYLCMTLEQLRAGYVIPGDIEVTIVGFSPNRPSNKINLPGFAGLIDLSEIWTQLVGQADLTIDPIAVYSEIKI